MGKCFPYEFRKAWNVVKNACPPAFCENNNNFHFPHHFALYALFHWTSQQPPWLLGLLLLAAWVIQPIWVLLTNMMMMSWHCIDSQDMVPWWHHKCFLATLWIGTFPCLHFIAHTHTPYLLNYYRKVGPHFSWIEPVCKSCHLGAAQPNLNHTRHCMQIKEHSSLPVDLQARQMVIWMCTRLDPNTANGFQGWPLYK